MGTELTKPETLSLNPPLSAEEAKALALGLRCNVPRLAPSTAAQLFELFLIGQTCEQIQRKNSGFSLPQVVLARVEGEWDRHKAEYQAQMLSGVRDRVMQAQLESTYLLCDLLAAQRKYMAERIHRYLQSGDEGELRGIQLSSTKNLKETIDLLLKATGQDNKPKQVDVVHHNLPPQAPRVVTALTPDQADEVLAAIDAKEGAST